MLHLFIIIPQNNPQLMVSLIQSTTNKHNVMQQPHWSIKTLSQLFVKYNLDVNFTELISNQKHQFTPFSHPNDKYQTSLVYSMSELYNLF
jgi:hypothetical protein